MALTIPVSLYVAAGSASFEVCDDEGCATAVKELGRLPGKPGPQGRGSVATFAELGREFAPGTVEVRVELRNQYDAVVAAREEPVKLSRYYPNGKACDGDGYVNGGLTLVTSDAT